MKKTIFTLLFTLLNLVACTGLDDGDEEVLYRLDEYGNRFSPTVLTGSVDYIPSMVPERVKIISMDGQWNPVDSFEVPLDTCPSFDNCQFQLGSRDYEFPVLKMVTVFPVSKKKKMEFYQYVHLHSSDDYIHHFFKQNIYGALVAERIKTLVKDEGLGFFDAEEKAYKELEKSVNVSYTKDGKFSWDKPGLFEKLPYLLCQHEISDSVFYSEYQTIRDSFAKLGKIHSPLKARAADAWLATFKTPSLSSSRELFRSESRDTSAGLGSLDTSFIKWAYEMNCSWRNEDSIKIANRSSEYNGRKFIYERTSGGEYYSGWRLKTSLEDTLGTCLYNTSFYGEHDGKAYLCAYESFVWKPISDIDTIMDYKYYRCERNSGGYGVVGSFGKSLYACSCDKADKCKWSKVEKDFKATTLDTVSVSVMATLRFGECRGHFGEREMMDSIFVMCSWNDRWVQVDSVVYNLGRCDKSNQVAFGQMPNGDYYKCGAFSGEWRPSSLIEANGYTCDWKNDSTYTKFEGKYFYCKNEQWREVPEDSVYNVIAKKED